MAKPRKKQVIALSGDVFFIDITRKALKRFGFQHGDRIEAKLSGLCSGPKWLPGTIMGVAHVQEWKESSRGHKVLWIAFDDDKGRVAYWFPFSKRDFRRI